MSSARIFSRIIETPVGSSESETRMHSYFHTVRKRHRNTKTVPEKIEK